MKTSRAIVFGGGLRQRWRPDLHNRSVPTVRGADDGVGWRRRCLASWRDGRRRLTGFNGGDRGSLSLHLRLPVLVSGLPARRVKSADSPARKPVEKRPRSWSNFPDMRIPQTPWGKPVHPHDVRGSELRDEFAVPMTSRGVASWCTSLRAQRGGEAYAPDDSNALLALAHRVVTALTLFRAKTMASSRLCERPDQLSLKSVTVS